MYIPKYLFYDAKTKVGVQLTTQYQPQLHVETALQNNPKCWIESKVASTKHKKAIVISDFFNNQSSYPEAEIVISALIKQGFRVFMTQKAGRPITELSVNEFNLPLTKNHCGKVDPHTLNKQMAKFNVAPEAIQVMDLQSLIHLQDEIILEKTIPKISKKRMTYTINDEEDFEEFNDSEEEITELICRSEALPSFGNLKNKGIDLQKLAIGGPSLAAIIEQLKSARSNNTLENLEFIDLLNCDMSPDDNIEPWLIELHKLFPKLRKIILPVNQPIRIAKYISGSSAKTLDPKREKVILDIGGSQFSAVGDLNVYDMEIIEKLSMQRKDAGESLENFGLYYSDISIENLTAHLKKVNMKRLYLSSITETENNPSFNGSQINDIRLSDSSSIATNTIIGSCPNLEFLTIDKLDFDAQQSVLAKLHSLTIYNNLENFPIDLQRVQLLAPNLESLEFSVGDFSDRETNIPRSVLPLPKLKDLTVYFPRGTRTTSDVLFHLEQVAPNVESLSLTDAQLSKDDLVHLLHNFTQLKKFKFASDAFPSTVTLSELLNAPSIENIDLWNFKISESFYKPGPLPNRLNLMRILTPFTNVRIDPNYIADIFSRSPALESIEISGLKKWNEIIKILIEKQVSLSQLEHIDFTYSNINYESFLLLRTLAPNLKSIKITNTPLINDIDKIADGKLKIENYSFGKYTASNDDLDVADVLDGVTDDNQEPSNNRNSHKITVAKDTIPNEGQKFNVTQVFYSLDKEEPDPKVNAYRNGVFHNAKRSNPFDLNNNDSHEMRIPYNDYTYGRKAVDVFKEQSSNRVLLSKINLELTNEFTSLPSWLAHEELKSIHASGIEANDIEIEYSTRDNLYYLRKKTPGTQPTFIEYIIEKPTIELPRIPSDLVELLAYMMKFKGGALQKVDVQTSATDVANEMYYQQLGKCDQRSAVFKYLVQHWMPDIPVRVVTNDCHAYVEIYLENHWRKYDLGGYPANLKIAQPQETTQAKQKIKSENKPLASVQNEPLDPRYITWDTHSPVAATANKLALSALNQTQIDSKSGEHLGSNVLLQCESDLDVNAMLVHLHKIAKETHKPVYVINNPSDIVCQNKWLKRLKDNTGKSMDGPGGPLYDFLTKTYSPDEQPIIIVNWNNFSADELVRFNSLIDADRVADGVAIPKNMNVVGVYNTAKPDAYTGSDFHSRNPVKLKVSAASQVSKEVVPIDFTIVTNDSDAVKIELYNSNQWKEILLGQWTLEAGQLHFIEGELALAIKQGKNVQLNNAPWHLPEFAQFWQTAKINGFFNSEGETLVVSSDFWDNITQSTGFNWQQLTGNMTFIDDKHVLKNALVINSGTFGQFIPHYNIADRLPERANSVFEQHQGKTLPILITQTLSTASWHQILKQAKHWNVKLQIGCTPDVALPEALAAVTTVKYLQDKIPTDPVTLIQTDDVGMTLADLRRAHPKAFTLDVSDFDQTDILYNLTPDFSQGIAFDQHFSDIWKKLTNKEKVETVILKGHFKAELLNALLPLCAQGEIDINGKREKINGKLIVVSDAPLTNAFEVQVVETDLSEKLKHLLNSNYLSEEAENAIKQHPWPFNSSLANMQAAINHYLRTSPPNFDYQEGTTKITSPSKVDQGFNLNEDHVRQVCDQFVDSRLSSLRAIFNLAPFAFVGGKTGVGKSTFMKNYLVEANGFKLYNEMSDILQWANDKTPGLEKVLFFDEANISDLDYAIFEGLYEVPPYILYKGNIIELTPNHKVVLAGNPMSYGGERHLPKLLADHGNACTFDVIPKEYIFQNIIKPVFDAVNFPQYKIQKNSQCILNVYQHICEMSNNQVFISPRELKMMAMVMASSKNVDREYISIVYDIAKQCIPAESKASFELWFKNQYDLPPPMVIPENTVSARSEKPFILTHSRAPIYESLKRILAVREQAITSPHKALQEPGLGGILLEGEPGTGKSHFLIDALKKQGYQPRPLALAGNKNLPPDPHHFYVIPAGLSFTEKKRVLLAAFDEGLPVVIDEINSGPMMEQMLNALLMGEHPDTKRPPNKPGFMLMATQNPISMAGRQATSLAIARRTLFHEFPAYDKAEMQQILKGNFKNIPIKVINQEIDKFMKVVNYAKSNNKEPAPVFRDLFNIVYKIAQIHEHNLEHRATESLSKEPPKRARVQSHYFNTLKAKFEDKSVKTAIEKAMQETNIKENLLNTTNKLPPKGK